MERCKYILCGAVVLVSLWLNARTPARTYEIVNPVEAKTEPVSVISTTKIDAEVTMYSGIESCNDKICTMASGKSAYIGAVACPRHYKIGTKIKIADSIYTCEDRTALRYDGRFDIFSGYDMKSHKEAMQWGIRNMTVFILQEI